MEIDLPIRELITTTNILDPKLASILTGICQSFFYILLFSFLSSAVVVSVSGTRTFLQLLALTISLDHRPVVVLFSCMLISLLHLHLVSLFSQIYFGSIASLCLLFGLLVSSRLSSSLSASCVASDRASLLFSAHQTPMIPCNAVDPSDADPSPSNRLASDSTSTDMKDIASSNRQSRNPLIYPKKRPPPYGIQKASKSPSLLTSYACRSPRSARFALIQQQQRLRGTQFCRKECVLLEEEYRDEIRYYMHDMEVSLLSFHNHNCPTSC